MKINSMNIVITVWIVTIIFFFIVFLFEQHTKEKSIQWLHNEVEKEIAEKEMKQLKFFEGLESWISFEDEIIDDVGGYKGILKPNCIEIGYFLYISYPKIKEIYFAAKRKGLID